MPVVAACPLTPAFLRVVAPVLVLGSSSPASLMQLERVWVRRELLLLLLLLAVVLVLSPQGWTGGQVLALLRELEWVLQRWPSCQTPRAQRQHLLLPLPWQQQVKQAYPQLPAGLLLKLQAQAKE